MPSTPFPLGRHPEAAANHDPRSRAFAATAELPVRTVRWGRSGESLNQQSVGACTAFAADGAANHAPLHATGTRRYTNEDSFRLYDWVTHNDPYDGAWSYSGSGDSGTGQDTGSDGLSAAKGMVHFARAVSYTHAFGPDHLAAGLQYGTFIIGIDWYDGMFYPASNGLVTISGSIAGGHEILVDGFNATTRRFRLNNSWGNGWGVYGRCYFEWDTMATLLGAGGDAIRLM